MTTWLGSYQEAGFNTHPSHSLLLWYITKYCLRLGLGNAQSSPKFFQCSHTTSFSLPPFFTATHKRNFQLKPFLKHLEMNWLYFYTSLLSFSASVSNFCYSYFNAFNMHLSLSLFLLSLRLMLHLFCTFPFSPLCAFCSHPPGTSFLLKSLFKQGRCWRRHWLLLSNCSDTICV